MPSKVFIINSNSLRASAYFQAFSKLSLEAIMKIHVEVYIASRILGQNEGTFPPDDLLRFIRNEFHDERHGISTHIGAACVANAPLNHARGYNYLWRIERGLMRAFRPGQDQPIPERITDPTQPEREDVPERFRYLLQ